MGSHAEFPRYNQHYLPIELVTEVCVGLPVKSLLRFRCVCKSWCSLISSSHFISLHLAGCRHDDDNTPFLASDFEGRIWLLPRHNPTYRETICDEPYFLKHLFFRGYSVNGLFVRADLGFSSCTKQTDIMLWNPLIRKALKLPPPLYVDNRVHFGLGYSRSSDDYKVVVIATNIRTVVIYTLRKPTWRKIEDYRDDVIIGVYSDGVFIDGYIYWISTRNFMISFDVNDEVFNYIILPNELQSWVNNGWRHPIVYRDLVGLLDLRTPDSTCSLWATTSNDQVPGSWSKLYTVCFGFENHPLRFMYFKHGKMIFVQRNGVLAQYDFESKEMMGNLLQSHGSRVTYLALYKESLVLL